MKLPEPWLRGAIPGIPSTLQPAAHALVMAQEDVERVLSDVTEEQLWLRPGGAASLGFHVAHLAGSTDRLLTYARGEQLSATQRRALDRERATDDVRPSKEELLKEWQATVDQALRQLRETSESTLTESRFVGRAQLPSTVLGLIFHAAEHAARHAGQMVTTAKVIGS